MSRQCDRTSCLFLWCSGAPCSISASQSSLRFSDKFAEIRGWRGRLDIEAAFASDFEAGAGGVYDPSAFFGEAGLQFAADDGHAFWRIGAEMEFAGQNHPGSLFAAMTFKTQALDFAVEIGIMFQHRARNFGDVVRSSSDLSPCACMVKCMVKNRSGKFVENM